MKEYYTRKEMKRIISLKAAEIVSQNPDALLNNTSYSTNLHDVIVVGSCDDLTYWYIGLEPAKDNWSNNEYTLVVIKQYQRETIEREEIMTVFELHTRKGIMYFANGDVIEKHYERGRMRYDTDKKRMMFAGKESDLAKKLIAKIEKETNRKIKIQDLFVAKTKYGYTINYIYRKQKYTLSLRFEK